MTPKEQSIPTPEPTPETGRIMVTADREILDCFVDGCSNIRNGFGDESDLLREALWWTRQRDLPVAAYRRTRDQLIQIGLVVTLEAINREICAGLLDDKIGAAKAEREALLLDMRLGGEAAISALEILLNRGGAK